MKFYATLSIRSDWTPQDLVSLDLGEVTPESLADAIKRFTTDKTLVVDISLWNNVRREELMELRSR